MTHLDHILLTTHDKVRKIIHWFDSTDQEFSWTLTRNIVAWGSGTIAGVLFCALLADAAGVL